MDVVYILGKGSLCGDLEIKYSLRALELNMLDLDRVFVVGENPDFLKDIIHIPQSDPSPEKWRNAYLKVIRACADPNVGADFLLMNDDFFMVEPFEGKDWPFYALKGSNGGVDGKHSFHVHCPIQINKEMFLQLPLEPDAKGKHSFRTFYANFYKAKPKFCEDFILRAADGCKDFDQQIIDRQCFSIGDSAMLYEPFRRWLADTYFLPSRFEVMKV